MQPMEILVIVLVICILIAFAVGYSIGYSNAQDYYLKLLEDKP